MVRGDCIACDALFINVFSLKAIKYLIQIFLKIQIDSDSIKYKCFLIIFYV